MNQKHEEPQALSTISSSTLRVTAIQNIKRYNSKCSVCGVSYSCFYASDEYINCDNPYKCEWNKILNEENG